MAKIHTYPDKPAPGAGDKIVISNAADGNNTYSVDIANLPGGGGDGAGVQVLQSGATSINLTILGTSNIGAATGVPIANRTLRCTLVVETASDALTTVSIGVAGTPARYMATTDNIPTVLGGYISYINVVGDGNQVIATVGGVAGTVGSAYCILEYI